ncbi:MAG TPA: DUF6150 family protein [Cyclobacteriaceae bacterium]|nr:DUF6150 family protein [Cyclobacteriaceae bacterium]
MNISLISGMIVAGVMGNYGDAVKDSQERSIDFCELKGSVYIEVIPSRADFRVYLEASEAFADMLVFEADNSLYADKGGIWYFVKSRGMADFTVCMVDAKNKAEFSICYTTYESMAGCSQ